MKRPRTLSGLLLAALRLQLARIAPEARAVLIGLAVVAVALLGALVLRTCTDTSASAVGGPLSRSLARSRWPRFLAEARHASGSGLALQPAIVAANGIVGAVWVDLRSGEPDVYFARIGADGARVGNEVQLSRGGFHFLPQVAWTGREYLVSWTEQKDEEHVVVNLARVAADGRLVGAPRTISGSAFAFAQDVACGASGCLAAWYEFSGTNIELRTTPLSLEGEKRGSEHRVALNGVPLGMLDIAWNGEGYAVAWNENAPYAESSIAMLVGVDANGRASAPVRVASADHYSGATAIAGGSRGPFALVWESDLNEEGSASLRFASSTARGVDVRPRPIAEAAQARLPALVPTDGDAALAWTSVQGGRYAIAFARVGRDGRLSTAVTRLSDGSHLAFGPTATFDGRDVVVAWTERGDHGFGIQLSRVGPDGRPRGNPVQIAQPALP